MKILIVGGTWDDNGGRPSSIVSRFATDLTAEIPTVDTINGGYYSEISNLLHKSVLLRYDVVFWWANVPNDKPKLRDVKAVNPKIILVGSKRNDDNKYNYQELISMALGRKQNLVVTFAKEAEKLFRFTIYDPLGNEWYNGASIQDCVRVLKNRLETLVKITRIGTNNTTDVNIPSVEIDPRYLNVVKKYAEKFHELIMPEPTTRFLGNSSFRCRNGFPSFRNGELIYVSKRNIDKERIDENGFVPVLAKRQPDEKVTVLSDIKPSVDTPVQLALYEMFPNINYMVHSHTYVKDGTFTSNPLPCGAYEEVEEINNTIADKTKHFYAINLIGHGCIIMSDDVDKLETVEFIARPIPEKQY